MNKIYLALGSNIGDRRKNIKGALRLIGEKIVDIQRANVYETKPVGYTNQGNFLNTAISGDTDLSPQELLDFLKYVEKIVGRVERFRWGPREIDIDILFYGQLIVREKNLEIPHPRLIERDFVLIPLIDIAPHFIHPICKEKIKDLLEKIPTEQRSVIV